MVWVLEQCLHHVTGPSCPPVQSGSRGTNGQVGSGPVGDTLRSTLGTRSAWQAHLLWPTVRMALGDLTVSIVRWGVR